MPKVSLMGMDDRPSWLESQLMPLCRIGMFALGNYSIVSMLRLAKVVRLVKLVFCAAAAKQCGHIRHASSPTSPFAHSVELAYAQRQAMSRNIDFLWLGAKWYGQSIQLMTSDISLEASQTTQTQTHWTGLAVNSAASPLSRISTVSTEARLIAACVMCQYEELSASTRAWASHLDGLFRLLRLDRDETAFANSIAAGSSSPSPARPQARQTFSWYFVLNDFEESCKWYGVATQGRVYVLTS
jgi:hypothetical protein